MYSESNKTNHVSCIGSAPLPQHKLFSVKHKDSDFTDENKNMV